MVNWLEHALLKVIDSGEIPEHIAIIMDGNRRYARKMGFATVAEGHKVGAKKLKQTIEWLSELHGVKMLTVYAFSLLNFERNQDEVKGLMDIAVETFSEMAAQSDEMKRRSCAIRFIGRTELLEKRVLDEIRRVEAAAPENPQFVLNICVCYTSHDEIERARDSCLEQNITPTLDDVFQRLELPNKPDLLIRTSGVKRMSNFLLMQCAETPIVVVDKLWPELSVYDFAKMIIKFQLRKSLPFIL